MVLKKHHSPQRPSILPSIPRSSQQRYRDFNDCHNVHIICHNHQDFTSKSLKLKSERNHERRILSQRERAPINSFKSSGLQSLHDRKPQYYSQKSPQKQMEIFSKQTKITQFHTKNSLMNKILSHHKKINKIQFQDCRSQLFGNFHKNNIYLNENLTEIKPLFDSPNQKIVALLNDRPFKKTSPMKYNISKLKMMNNIKNLAKQNELLGPSFDLGEFQQKSKDLTERQSEPNAFRSNLSNLKNNRSLTFIEKSFIKTDFLKECTKSFNKLERFSSLENEEKTNRKRSLLMISDEQKSQKNLETIVSQLSEKLMRQKNNAKKENNQAQNTKYNSNSNEKKVQQKGEKDKEQENRQAKCQERILSDLIRLQQMRNKQCYAENKILRLKSTRLFAQNIKQIKLQGKDKDKLKSHKIKYLVKFKTEPKENPQDKLEAKLSRIIPEIQTLRNKLLEETKFGEEEVSGVAQPLCERGSEMREKSQKSVKVKVRESQSLRRTMVRHFENSFAEKEVTGWETEKEIEIKDSWNFRF